MKSFGEQIGAYFHSHLDDSDTLDFDVSDSSKIHSTNLRTSLSPSTITPYPPFSINVFRRGRPCIETTKRRTQERVWTFNIRPLDSHSPGCISLDFHRHYRYNEILSFASSPRQAHPRMDVPLLTRLDQQVLNLELGLLQTKTPAQRPLLNEISPQSEPKSRGRAPSMATISYVPQPEYQRVR